MNEKILVVDDDADIREMMCNYFSKEGYKITCAKDGCEAIELLNNEKFSLILLDIMMPKLDGYAVMSRIRTFTEVPVILLTAKGEQLDKILGFTKGCDDYIVKPFDFTELSFRIRAILKRSNAIYKPDEEQILKVKDLEINPKEYSVVKGNKHINLTPKEFDIICLLASNKGRVYSTKLIYESIWKDTFLENDNSVLTHIRNLREKIGDNVKEGKYIKTIWGVGYKIEKDT